ncbi:hypothetical protein SE15_11175 [Thermanaerothrix daxensis]|uniref:Uncharacterized protein n=1 Tax=Thermanaerothrix daxensis TaxID=869279 RepID=A0A0P6Y0Z3_9CHLR|nr:hypothetical protein [Thermanaerothrix daxensis]KPL82652.1 hypothetical protein SE15_11175 [Thermanaerothrix daxensis]
MPYPNEHAARLVDPSRFEEDSFRRVNDKFGEGIHAIFGRLKGEDSLTLQAIRFDADKFSAEEARQWLRDHDYQPLEFEEATNENEAEKSLSYFIPLQKVIEARREVWGVAAIEQPDMSGEIMDYAKSKPHFWAWSKRVQKASRGRSYGNVRDSHTTRAVGKVIKMIFDDAAKAIRVGVKVVDSEAWQKVVEGVFTGFSIGGRYGERWEDPINKGYVRYEAIPNEISLVDLPCIPGATFEVIKADGSRIVTPILSMKGVAMKERILKLLKQDEGKELDEEKIQEIAEEIVAMLEERSTASEDDSGNAEDAVESEETPEDGEEQVAEEQPKTLTADDVREIVLSILAEFGLIERVGSDMQLSARIRGMAKSKSQIEQLVRDVAKLALEVEALSKRGASGPVLREIGSLTPQASAALQKAEVLKAALQSVTDPLAQQALRNEIARLEIQAIQTKS